MRGTATAQTHQIATRAAAILLVLMSLGGLFLGALSIRLLREVSAEVAAALITAAATALTSVAAILLAKYAERRYLV